MKKLLGTITFKDSGVTEDVYECWEKGVCFKEYVSSNGVRRKEKINNYFLAKTEDGENVIDRPVISLSEAKQLMAEICSGNESRRLQMGKYLFDKIKPAAHLIIKKFRQSDSDYFMESIAYRIKDKNKRSEFFDAFSSEVKRVRAKLRKWADRLDYKRHPIYDNFFMEWWMYEYMEKYAMNYAHVFSYVYKDGERSCPTWPDMN